MAKTSRYTLYNFSLEAHLWDSGFDNVYVFITYRHITSTFAKSLLVILVYKEENNKSLLLESVMSATKHSLSCNIDFTADWFVNEYNSRILVPTTITTHMTYVGCTPRFLVDVTIFYATYFDIDTKAPFFVPTI